MADMDNLVGSSLSLISQQDVRYDGKLFSINAKESSIVLRDVKCFGTEDRVTEEYKKIPPNDKILPFVTFPGNEIKDLSVFETDDNAKPSAAPTPAAETTAKPTTKPAEKPKDPPTTVWGNKPVNKSTNANAGSGSGTTYNNNNKSQNQASKPASSQGNQRSYNNDNQSRPNTNQNNNTQRNKPHTNSQSTYTNSNSNNNRDNSSHANAPKSTAGTGEHLAKLKLKGNHETEGVANLTAEFDFSEGLNNFNKTEVLAQVASEKNTSSESGAVVEVKYVKDDFFDMLSNDAGGSGTGHGMNRQEERSLNQDTFGAIAVQQSHYRRGGYHGRGRGSGRSGGSGGGRGRGGRMSTEGSSGSGRGSWHNKPAAATAST